MGILDIFGISRKRFDALNGTPDLGLASPFSDGGLTQIRGADIFGELDGAGTPLTRESALTVPAVARARHLLCSSVAAPALVALRSGTSDLVQPQPTFLSRTNSDLSPEDRMAASVDDLIFYGLTLWLVERGTTGAILSADWTPKSTWSLRDGVVLLDERPLREDQYLLFHIPRFPGLLAWGARTLRGAIAVEQAWTARIKSPGLIYELDVIDDTNLTQSEADDYVKSWTRKHTAGTDPVGLTPAGMKLNVTANPLGDSSLFLESRNAIRTDVGSFLGVRPAMLDGTTGIDSLTYTTEKGQRNLFFDFDLPMWLQPFESRLSLDDVVPRGQRVRFNLYSQYNIPPATGVPTED